MNALSSNRTWGQSEISQPFSRASLRNAGKPHLYPNLSPWGSRVNDGKTYCHQSNCLTVRRGISVGLYCLCACVYNGGGLPGGWSGGTPDGRQGGTSRAAAAALTLWTPAGCFIRGPDRGQPMDKHTTHTHVHTSIKPRVCMHTSWGHTGHSELSSQSHDM